MLVVQTAGRDRRSLIAVSDQQSLEILVWPSSCCVPGPVARMSTENVNSEASGPYGRAASHRARITPLASGRTASSRPYFRARGGHADQRPSRPAESCAMTRCQPTHPSRTRPPRPPGRSWSLADYQEDPDASRPGWAAAGVLSRGQLACFGQRQALLPWYRSCRTSRAGRSLSPVPSSSCSSAR